MSIDARIEFFSHCQWHINYRHGVMNLHHYKWQSSHSRTWGLSKLEDDQSRKKHEAQFKRQEVQAEEKFQEQRVTDLARLQTLTERDLNLKPAGGK